MPTIACASPMELLDAQIAKRHLLTHPFYQAWTRGALTKEALQDYARQYYHHVKAFPAYLSALHSRAEDPDLRRHVFENLVEEEGGEVNHPELWLRFAEGLGVAREEVQSVPLYDETREAIAEFRAICRNERETEALAAIYAYESQIPEIARAKIDGLREHFGITQGRALAYFVVHEDADRRHRAVERDLLERLLPTSDLDAVRRVAGRALDALWDLLSGVARRHGIPCEAVSCTA